MSVSETKYICFNLDFIKGISFVTNENNEKIAVQIDIKTIIKHHNEIADFLDIIIANSRKDDEDINWSNAKEEMKKEGKL